MQNVLEPKWLVVGGRAQTPIRQFIRSSCGIWSINSTAGSGTSCLRLFRASSLPVDSPQLSKPVT